VSAVYTFPVTKARSLKAYFTRIGSPSSLKAYSTGYNSIKLTWKSVTGAKGYYVYRSTSRSGTYSRVAAVAGKTYYTDTGRTPGRTYYFKVKAYCIAGTKVTAGGYSSRRYAKALPSKVGGLTLAKPAAGSAAVSWNAVNGASGYEVYRSTRKTSRYTRVATTALTDRTFTGLKPGTGYYFKVRAYCLVSGKKVYGSYSDIKYIRI